MALTKTQQHLLNYFKLIHVSSYENTIKVFEQIGNTLNKNQSDNSNALLGDIAGLNKKLKEFDLAIVERYDQYTSEKLFVLINTSPDTIFQHAKFYNKNCINLLSEIIRECILSEKGCVKEIFCLNLSSQIGTSKTDIQFLLENLIKEKWLVSREGIVSVGMRSLVELEQNLKDSFGDVIQSCPLCKFICIQSFSCNKCNTKYHFGCTKKYIAATSKSDPKCCNCREKLENLELLINSEKMEQDDEETLISE